MARCGSRYILVVVVSGLLLACSYGPMPLTPDERAEIIAADHRALRTQQEVVDHPVGLFEAMARALKYNLEHRVSLLEKSVAQKQWDLSFFDLLPQVNASAALKARNTPEASSGFSITDGTASTSYSTAQDRSKKTANLVTVWNVLDFGVSVVQARQESDRVLIAEENRRKAVHTLLQDVRSTFWRAAGAQKLEKAIGLVIQKARRALVDARQVERERLRPPLEILRFQKTLLEIVRQFQDLRHQLSLAKTEFSSLINLSPGTHFTLDIPDDPALAIPPMTMTIDEMEQLALDNRPEAREAMYKARISRGDVRKAMLRLLPGLEFQASHEWDSNSFSLHAQWEEAGARVAWNLLNLVQGPMAVRMAENREALENMRRLTLHMAILSQVHLSFRQNLDDQRKLKAAEEIDSVDQRILKNFRLTASNDAQSQLEYINASASAIMSRLQLYQAYADAQNAVGRIFVTLGVDLFPQAVRADSVSALAGALREAVMAWDEGVSGGPFQELMASLNVSPEKPAKQRGTVSLAVERKGKDAWKERNIPFYFLQSQPFMGVTDLEKKQSRPETERKSEGEDGVKGEREAKGKVKKNEGQDTVVPPVPDASLQNRRIKVEPELFEDIQNLLQAWASAWSRRDPEAYFEFYEDKLFHPAHGQSLKAWRRRMRDSLGALGALQVDVRELEVVWGASPIVLADSSEEELSVGKPVKEKPTEWLQASFRESYRSSHLHAVSQKFLMLGKTADGWKIFREASEIFQPPQKPGSKPVPLSAGFAVQVALVDQLEKMQKIRREWSKKGLRPTVIETLDQKNKLLYSVRVAYFREKGHAVFFRWSLQLMEGIESVVVPASIAEMSRAISSGMLSTDTDQSQASPDADSPVKPSQKPAP